MDGNGKKIDHVIGDMNSDEIRDASWLVEVLEQSGHLGGRDAERWRLGIENRKSRKRRPRS